ncbi:MAG TPA: septum formation family protein [Catenuloplanes sp.]
MRRPSTAAGLLPRRSRLLTVLTIGALLVAPLSGCGKPLGIDGELADDWTPVSAPTPFTPPAGSCHTTGYSEVGYLASFEAVDCSASHRTETVHVGAFPAAAAGLDAPPAKGSAEARTAYQECDRKAKDFVGADWRLGRLWLGVVLPSPEAWSGGARWFRCDMTEMTTVEDDGETVSRTGSLSGVLKAASPITLTCYAVRLNKAGAIETMPPSDCAKPHNAEFAGLWNAPEGPYPKKDADWDRFHDECRKIIAGFAKLPVDANIRFRTGVVSLPAAEDQWQLGNRGVRCYLWLNDKKLTRSMKGAGAGAMPVQFEPAP